MTVRYARLGSPVGEVLATSDGAALTGLALPGRGEPGADWVADRQPFAALEAWLADYAAGRDVAYAGALAPSGTPFQLAVWLALRDVPLGATVSYGELARRIGRPSAVRAVGRAVGANPLPLVLPCHRVIGADGSLTGFGGGLALKERLLAHEGAALGAPA